MVEENAHLFFKLTFFIDGIFLRIEFDGVVYSIGPAERSNQGIHIHICMYVCMLIRPNQNCRSIIYHAVLMEGSVVGVALCFSSLFLCASASIRFSNVFGDNMVLATCSLFLLSSVKACIVHCRSCNASRRKRSFGDTARLTTKSQ